MKQPVEMIAHEQAPVEGPYDDRLELIEIVYGPRPDSYRAEKVTKIEAFNILYDYYNDSDSPMIPRHYPADKALREKAGKKINDATIYVKMRFKDVGTGVMTTVIKDVPLWIAVERAVSHKHHVELITKAEHDAFYRQVDDQQNQWRVQMRQERERLDTMGGIRPQIQVNNNKV